jgi:hypothetical protein
MYHFVFIPCDEVLQMTTARQSLFAVLSSDESMNMSGGISTLSFNLDDYMFVLGAAQVFGNPGVTADEVQAAWKAGLGGLKGGSGSPSSGAMGLAVGNSRTGNLDLAVP